MIKVVKIGGNVVDNPELLKQFVKDFAAMPGMKILVHGGGVMASQMQKSMGMVPVMVEGRRVTDEEYSLVEDALFASGIEDGFLQDEDSASGEFIPCFDNSGV